MLIERPLSPDRRASFAQRTRTSTKFEVTLGFAFALRLIPRMQRICRAEMQVVQAGDLCTVVSPDYIPLTNFVSTAKKLSGVLIAQLCNAKVSEDRRATSLAQQIMQQVSRTDSKRRVIVVQLARLRVVNAVSEGRVTSASYNKAALRAPQNVAQVSGKREK